MKIQRRNFIKNTIAGAVSVSLAGFLPGLILKGCGLKTDINKTNMKKLIIKEILHEGVIAVSYTHLTLPTILLV